MKQLSTFEELSAIFEEKFQERYFPGVPKGLYDAAQYPLSTGGKRVRPVICLMANELFTPINEDTIFAAIAIELFHNFTLVHDDIMDRASLRRGQETVHKKYGMPIALLSGDTTLIYAYDFLEKISLKYLRRSLQIFNDAARKVCEGQYLDMEYEHSDNISTGQYVEMISLKTSVLLAASMKMGALLGGAGVANQENLYEFGKNLGIAFQIQDDYLDAFGDPEKFGKKVGGDIMANKKTFLLLHTLNTVTGNQKAELEELLSRKDESKIGPMLRLYLDCGAEEWAKNLKSKYFDRAMEYLEEVAVVSSRKEPFKELAHYLLERDL